MWLDGRIVNHPSDGFERQVANHLAVVRASDYTGCQGDPKSLESPLHTSRDGNRQKR
jgi:hypothetical protein